MTAETTRTYTISRVRTSFTRVGYAVSIFNADGSPYPIPLRMAHSPHIWRDPAPVRFYGDDGRKVRAEAVAFAKEHGATRRAV